MTAQCISLDDVALDSKSNPTIIWLMIEQSKTDPFRMGVNLCLGHTTSVVCPVKAVLPYLAICGSSLGPLFAFEDETPLTRTRFKSLLSATLKFAGPVQYPQFPHWCCYLSQNGRVNRSAYPTVRPLEKLSLPRILMSVLKQLSQQLVSTPRDLTK